MRAVTPNSSVNKVNKNTLIAWESVGRNRSQTPVTSEHAMTIRAGLGYMIN